MTAHPIDTEALRRLADQATPGPWRLGEAFPYPASWVAYLGEDGWDERTTVTSEDSTGLPDQEVRDAEFIAAARTAVPALLDALAAAEHRATRVESERDEWRQTALDERGAALDALEQVKVRDARIKAVRDVHYPAHNDQDRTPFCPDCKGAPGVHECGCWRYERESPVCGHCRGWKGVGPVEWPCPTIQALDA